MKTLILISTAALSLTVAYGQTDKLNQVDTKGKKDGKWSVYLDSKWKEVKDNSQAVYSRYTWYEHGTNLCSMGSFEDLTLVPSDNNLQMGQPKLLNGEYKWIDKNGQTKFILVLKDGEFVSYKEYYKSGKMHEYFDYTKKWQGQPHTYWICIYDKEGKAQSYFYTNGKDGWMGYGTNADSTAVESVKVAGDSTFTTATYYKEGKLIRKTEEITIKKSDGKTETIYHGWTTSWFLSGQKREEGQYFYGKKSGQWKHWDESGKEIPEKDIHSQ
jgi:antitoxin component YwqK of YwqJK toxin-antitoxin module